MNLTKFSSLLGAVMVLAGAGQLQAQTLTGQSSDPAGWSTVWYDDFTGSVLDGTKWNIETNTSGGGNNELQYYGPEGVSVSGGNLVLTASREARSGKAFTSGRINSRGKVYFTHGKLEARIKLPKTAKGLWPAFWMLGENIGTNPWPQCGEIDILEMGHKDGWNGTNDPEKYMNGACHWGYYENGGYPNYAKAGNAPRSVQDGEYHLFTCVWDKEKVAMYLDKATTPYFEMNISSVATDKDPGNYFHKNFHILFNLAVGGSFPGILDPNAITAALPAKMFVDWVRISQPAGDDAYKFNIPDVSEEDQDVYPEDPDTKPGLWGKKALDSNGKSTFDINNASDVVLIATSQGVTDSFNGKIRANYNVDNSKNFFYIWENTYTAVSTKGVNSFGYSEAYTALEVGAKGWSGAGYASEKGKGKDLSMLAEDNYVLHFSMKGADLSAHRTHTITVGNVAFNIGKSGSGVTLGDYPRDGQWYSFDIPLKVLRSINPTLFDNASSFEGNVFAVKSGGFGGTRIQFDNVFFYKSAAPIVDVPTTDTETEIGRYASKALENNTSTFDFANGYEYVPVMASPAALDAMSGKIKLNLNAGGGNSEFYIWKVEGTDNLTYGQMDATGINSMGEQGKYTALRVDADWSGGGVQLSSAKDISFLTDDANKYWLHFAMKGNDILMHANQTIGIGKAQFVIGNTATAVGDYRRDGEWYAFDIPVSALKVISDPLFDNASAFSDYIFTISTGGTKNAQVQFDNVFFYRNDTKNADEPVVDPTPSMTVKIAAGATSCKPNEKITFTVTPTYKNCTISKVQVKVGDTAYDATAANDKYTYEWTAPAAGSYNVKGVVTTTDNKTYESSAVTVTVAEEATPSMTVAIAASASSCKKNEKVTFTVTPTYQNCTISKVQVKVGDNAYDATKANGKYAYEWTAPAAGSYSVKAVVTTTDNMTYESSAITVTVTEEATVDPDPSTGEKTFPFTAAQASEGTLYGDGYVKYSWDGTYVTVTAHFNNPENYPGGNLNSAYFFNKTNGHAQARMTTVSNGEFTIKLEGYHVGETIKGQVKIEYPNGLAVTPMTEYTIDGNPEPVKYTYKGITDTANVKCYDTEIKIPYRVVKIDSNNVETVLTQEEARALNLKVFYAWAGNDDAQKAQALTTPTGTYSCTGLTTGTDYAFYEKFYITVGGNETQIDGKGNFHFTAKTPDGEGDSSLDNDVEVLLTTGLITPVDFNNGTYEEFKGDANRVFIPAQPTEDGAIYWERLVKGKVKESEEYQFINLHMYYWAEYLSTGQLRFTFTYVDVDHGYKPVGLVPAVHFFDSETDEPMNESKVKIYNDNEPLRCPETFEPWPTTGTQASAPARVISYNNNAEIERQMTELGYKTTRVETVDAYEKPSVKYQFNMQYEDGGLIRSNIQKIDNIETGVNVIEAENGVYVRDGKIIAPEGSMIFDMQGQRMNADNALQHGIYIVVSGRTAVKVLVK